MKNLNLIKRLWTDSHEKQSPQRFRRYAAMLLMLLTLGVGQMWADIAFSGGYIYFDNSLGINSTTLQLCARQSAWTGVSSLSNISNTKLYYVANPQGSGWGGILGWVVISANPAKSNSNFDNWSSYTWCSDWNTYGFNSGSTYLIVPSSTAKSQSVTTSYLSGGYSALNSTQTINTVVKTGSGSYTAANSKATISITSYKMTGNGAVTKQTTSISTSAKTQTVSAARTATTTYTVGDVASGYQFDGWYTAATGGTQLSASKTYTYYPTAATTVYARFSEKMSTVTLSASPSGKGSFTIGGAAATSTSVGVTTTKSVTAVPISGYHFVSWAITGGATISGANDNPVTVTGTGTGTAATLTATFEADDVNSLTVSAGTHVTTVTGSTSPVTLGSKYAINATAFETGWQFLNWTASPAENGTFDNASSASTNVTVKNGSVVVTANAQEKMTTITVNVNPASTGTLTVGGAAFTPGNTTTAGVATGRTVVATPQPGYRFTGWTATNCSVASTSSASTTLSGNGTAGSGTLVANFVRTYAYLEGRMTVYNAARSTETHVGSSKGKWSESSFNIAMDYDATNHRFSRHTYKTPAELSATQTDGTAQSQWFSIARSNASGSWSGKTTYHPSSNTDLTTTGIGQKKAAQTSTTSYNYKFNSSTTNGYAIIYFDEAGVWYELEHTLNYNGNGSTSGSAPSQAYYNHGTNATAASNPFSKTNYTFDGWNTEQYITGTSYAAGASVPMSTNTTLYAKWTRIITLNANGGGSGSTSVTATYNCATLPSITNPSKTGYTFGGWNTANDGSGDIVINTSGAFLPITGWCDSQKRFTRTASGATLYAKWTQTVTLNANLANHGSGSNKSATIVYKATDKSSITHCTPATGYHLVGYYTAATDGVKVLNADGSFASSAVTDYITDGKWTKAGATTLYAQYEVNTYTIHYDPNGEATGSMDDQAATWGNYPTLTSNGFTREGYTFAGWATSPTGVVVYSNGQTLSTNLTNDNNATVTLYAKWTGKEYTVTFNARGGSGLTPTSKDVTMGSAYGELATVTPPAGYVFDGWYTAAGGGTKVESSTLVATPSDHTLYAHYAQKAQVYFKNTLGWSKVYVVYDANWDGSQGTGSEGKIYREMTKVAGTSDVYYDDIPDEYITSWRWNIAFNNTYQYNYHAFTKGEAVFRYDFDKKATMFVPTSNKGANVDGNFNDVNNVQYRSTGYKDGTGSNPEYTSGYWRTYNNTYSGYTMTYQKNRDSGWSSGHKMESSSVSSNVFIYTVHMDANSQYNFAFYKERDVNTKSVQFNYRTQITSTACTDLKLVCDPNNAWMQTTVEGDYVFKLEMKNDGHMYLTVEYPFKANDYKVVYSYTKDGAKTYDSEIIRGRANGLDTISVFIHSSSDASSRSLKIAQCTGINASGIPTWNNSYATIDISSVSESGVYDFIITQNGSAAATGAYWNKYTGNYYIRTESSAGGWDFYKEYADNLMTYSEYSLTQTLSDPYSHYYCKYIGTTTTDISYTVATDYSPAICPVLTGDATIGMGNKTLYDGKPASVRFTYNEETNETFRAYLKSAQGAGNTRFLLIHGKTDDMIFNSAGAIIADSTAVNGLKKNELLFKDTENWVYELAIKAKPGAQVSIIAQYNGIDRYLVGDVDSYETIINGETSTTKYNIAAVYDFKTNRLITTWIPDGTISEDITEVDVMIERQYQDGGTTITFGKASEEAKAGTISAKRVIGALKFDYNDLVGKVANWTPATRAKMMFFISFPFDVNVSDIFGLNSSYGQAFIVQKYNGALRAEKGFFLGDGTTSFWEILPVDSVMHANVGYVVTMDNDYLNGDVGHVWDNKRLGDHVYLYFPSANDPEEPIVISSDPQTIKIPAHKCKIDRTFGKLNHKYTDSNWNLMGVPIFQNHTGNATEGTPGAIFTATKEPTDTTDYKEHPDLGYFYQWGTDKNYTIRSAVGFTFLPMHCYMVQYAGDVKFTCAEPSVVPASVAARRTPMTENYNIDLQVLNSNDEMLNHTYVELRENAIDTFAVNEDTYMLSNNKDVNVYTFAGAYDVAANVLSIGSHVVPVGVIVNRAGTYTFSMPSNFSGSVTLVDKFAQTRTNLNIEDYEVYLETGTVDDRFELEININKVPTAIDGVEASQGSLKDGKAHKFIMNDQMYILKDGVLYDARGNRVK